MQKNNRMANLFPILLFLVFTLSAIGVILFTIRIYQTIIKESEEGQDLRIAVNYVTEKFRNNDTDGRIGVSSFNGHDAIELKETVQDVPYITYIYESGGYLRELFAQESQIASMGEDSGTAIMELNSFNPKRLSDSLIKISIEGADGEGAESYLSVQSSADVIKGVELGK